MGNLVTNIIKFTGKPEALKAALTSAIGDAADTVDLTRVAASWRDDVDVAFSLATLVPEPDVVAATDVSERNEDIGLAILSVGGLDWIRAKTERDPFESAMPPEYGRTTIGILKSVGLDGLSGKALHVRAAEICPGALPAGRAARDSFKATGHFNWRTWRTENWGTRASGETATVHVEAADCISLRFDTVNTAPNQWFMAFAKANPEVMCEGAGYDEDTDYAVSFVGDEPGELLISETDDAESVEFAMIVVHGPRPVDDRDSVCTDDSPEM